jgi:hypothetical protein
MPSQVTISAPNSLSSGVAENVTSIALGPGAYLIWGQADFALSVATVSQLQVGLSLVSATLPVQAGSNGLGPDPVTTSPIVFTLVTNTCSQQCGPTVLTLTVPSTLYLVAAASFSIGSVSVMGTIGALATLGAGHNLLLS